MGISGLHAQNPVIRNIFTADPAPMVYNDTVFLYAGQDTAAPGTNGYRMPDWHVFSSTDMVNWTDRGAPLAPTSFSWAAKDANAAHCTYRNGKFYWYVSVMHKRDNNSNGGVAIGVAVSDSPTGPFTDALGKALVTNEMTTDMKHSWDDLDPAVFIDDDGQAYLFWGNGSCKWAKLKENMIEIDGPITTMKPQHFTEAPWVYKRNGLYYLVYAANFPETIEYCTAKSITGPWEYRGVIQDRVTNSTTTHPGIIDYKGKSYFFYHNGTLPSGGSFRRSVCIEYLNYNADGTIQKIPETTEGVRQTEANITVDVRKRGHAISPTLFGVFFEDINLSADGGLYPEMIRNRSFEDADTLQNWKFSSAGNSTTAAISVANVHGKVPSIPVNPFNRKSLVLNVNGAFALENEGYWGINVKQNEAYTFKLAVRTAAGEPYKEPLQIKLTSSSGKLLASGVIQDFTTEWKYHSLHLTALASDANARIEITGDGKGKLFLDMVSLLPDTTWKGHGMRTDLAAAMNALNPKFLRFPGGCWVEGEDFEHMYKWKNTIGKADARVPLWNIWGYNATNGIGYHEYLQMAEDLGAEPLFCINAGVSHRESVTADQLGPWIQDALDAIEYANGPVNSVWGSIRAKNGHPAPFHMKYLEIGNENFGKQYFENYELIAKAILAKYPGMKLIANDWSGGHPSEPRPEIIDEHYYDNPDWFVLNATKYDTYDRKGPKVFVGEYAVTSNTGKGNLRGGIAEAAWMTGMERNSDVVAMAAYAPLYCNVNHKKWPVNLINFDNHRWYGLPGYYVQQMFAANQGTVNLPVVIEGGPAVELPEASGRIGLGTWNNTAEFKDLKVIAPDGKLLYQADFSGNLDDWTKSGTGEWSVQNGVLRQSALNPGVTAYVGDTSWKDYTISLKARKIAGENGFQIYFHNKARSGRIRWDIGGYNNSTNEMQIGLNAGSMKGSVEPGRWYDVKLEITANTVKGYLDGKLVQEVSSNNLNTKAVCASASSDDRSGDIIVKLVNTAASAVKTTIKLDNATGLTGKCKAIILTSASPLDENTLEEPVKVAPKTEDSTITGTVISRTLPACSLTVLRLSTHKQKM
ncbi:alpha-L-arabinofuranosidase [Filimonas effusa]|uniref:non-reducing end alpha-L-arabinofuranosidase n=2 Tax=Filimonas effusa TaxID=2508721 RepID=A0A4Q1DDB8_9BACT|nr:alpha-L-arabinofuranosidase [Filimonas effusa]